MKNPLPTWARLHPDLSTPQRITAITLIVIGALMSILCITTIFTLADLGRPSFLPWIAWLFFGIAPIATALEAYGAEENEYETTPTKDTATDEILPTPPRLRLVHSREPKNDRPYDQERDHAHHHVRTTG